ncbi:hypothetical protein N7474_006405 [Penicillium riverlandense]|uniref:uncharacterized protein n=1 Tax=Penicillium riverlandense TaxID=1903569 RepID=UPI0025490A89|nr:uncharacterized protein N7474_006405 [Penicillium riverlandense]KAJ5814628.1 hypothetical protein N7474_006405 [Penicillium riverlandense]
MPDLHSLPEGWYPEHSFRNNGPDNLLLERMKLRELAEGWPCYRDACEWENFASIFHEGAYLYTTWSGKVLFTDFFEVSKAGMDKGAFIMHRCHGTTTDITPDGHRAVTKMKATITQRFVIDGVEVDVECDCRFCFFFEKVDGRWGARFVRHWYEKDKIIPVNPSKIPKIDDTKLASYPEGYKFLAYCQEKTMDVSVIKDMPGHNRHKGTPSGDKHDLLYKQAKVWLEGGNLEI